MLAADFFDRYGEDLFYVKSDIEGGDIDVLFGLMSRVLPRPKYLSIEATATWHLGVMRALGYDGFKLINQAYSFDWTLPVPAIHGKSVDHQFRTGSSGPFGEEAAGEWRDADSVADTYASIRHINRDIPQQTWCNWWDFHARHSG